MKTISLSSFSSPFMFPRITGAEVMDACRLTAKRLTQDETYRKLVSVRPRTLEVTFNGANAFATYTREIACKSNCNAADVNFAHPEARLATQMARINLPYVDPGLFMSRKTANNWVGYIVHELLHILYTNERSWASLARSRQKSTWGSEVAKKYKGGYFKQRLLNGLEDARIELCGQRLGFAPGAYFCIHSLVRDMVASAYSDHPHDFEQVVYTTRNFPWLLAVGLRGYGVGEKRVIDEMPEPLLDIYKYALKAFKKAQKNADFWDMERGTTLMVRIATSVFRRLSQLHKEQNEPQPKANKEEKGEDKGQDDAAEGDDAPAEDDDACGADDADGSAAPDDAPEDNTGNGGVDDGDEGDEAEATDTNNDGFSRSGKYEDPMKISKSKLDLKVEPSPSLAGEDWAMASAREFSVYVVKPKKGAAQ